MIKEMKPLSLAEAKKISKENEGREDVLNYIKKFSKMKEKDALELRKEIEALDNHKVKGEHIAKIIDLMPEDASDLNKIFVDTSLDENEIKQITDIVDKYR